MVETVEERMGDHAYLGAQLPPLLKARETTAYPRFLRIDHETYSAIQNASKKALGEFDAERALRNELRSAGKRTMPSPTAPQASSLGGAQCRDGSISHLAGEMQVRRDFASRRLACLAPSCSLPRLAARSFQAQEIGC
jgi:hypothetical protein